MCDVNDATWWLRKIVKFGTFAEIDCSIVAFVRSFEVLRKALTLEKEKYYSLIRMGRVLRRDLFYFLFYLGFLLWTLTIHRQQGKGEAISLNPLYHFHSFYRQWDISRVIAADRSPLHIASSRTRTGSFCFLSASR